MRYLLLFGFLSVLSTHAVAAPLPGVSLDGLDKEDINDLVTLLTEGACPCDPKLSLRVCIEQKVCPPATALANAVPRVSCRWSANMSRGMPEATTVSTTV